MRCVCAEVRRRADLRHPNLVIGWRGLRCGSSSGGVCGYRSGSVGRSVGRGHRGGRRAGRHGAFRRRQNRRLRQVAGARRPRPADARASSSGQPALYVATRDGLRGPECRTSTRRAWAWRRPGTGRPAHACGDPRARQRRRRGVGRAAVTRRRARGQAGDRQRATRHPARRPGPGYAGRISCFPGDAAPVAIEVELSVKGARALEAICRAWARCRPRKRGPLLHPAARGACRFPPGFGGLASRLTAFVSLRRRRCRARPRWPGPRPPPRARRRRARRRRGSLGRRRGRRAARSARSPLASPRIGRKSPRSVRAEPPYQRSSRTVLRVRVDVRTGVRGAHDELAQVARAGVVVDGPRALAGDSQALRRARGEDRERGDGRGTAACPGSARARAGRRAPRARAASRRARRPGSARPPRRRVWGRPSHGRGIARLSHPTIRRPRRAPPRSPRRRARASSAAPRP
jgi:hypothetical protein